MKIFLGLDKAESFKDASQLKTNNNISMDT